MYPSDTSYLDNVKKGERGMLLSWPQVEEAHATRVGMPLFFMSVFSQTCSGKSGQFRQHPRTQPKSNRRQHSLGFCHVTARVS